MNSPLSQNSKKLPFGHVLIRTLPEAWKNIKQIYAEDIAGRIQILEEHCVHGDPVNSPARELETLNLRAGGMSVWTVPLSYNSKESCIVFAPKDFDIELFHSDLILLFMLAKLGSYCGRRDYLCEWREFAGFLAGNANWCNAQAWWFISARVVVISCLSENYYLLSNALLFKLTGKKKWSATISLRLSISLVERAFKKASSILIDEMRRCPWKDEVVM